MKLPRITLWSCMILMAAPLVYQGVEWFGPRARAVDTSMAQAGKELFLHEWKPHDPLSQGGDGLGPVFNAISCVACHRQGGTGGSGPIENNVNIYTIRPQTPAEKPRQGVVHMQAVVPELQERLSHVHGSLPASYPPASGAMPPQGVRGLNFPQGVNVSQRKTPALFGAKLIDDLLDREIVAVERMQQLKWGLATSDSTHTPVGRALRRGDGRVGKFGWKAQTVSLSDFVRAACANELGLGNPGQAQPQPLGDPNYSPTGFDLTLAQCDQLTAFIGSLPQPVERVSQDAAATKLAHAGKRIFSTIGCADCHVPDVANIKGIYSDLLLHRMGQQLEGGGDYNDSPLEESAFPAGTGPHPTEWRTPPLWGVAKSAPYLHDGRAATLEEAIMMHKGQGDESANRFDKLTPDERGQLVAFLKTLDTP